jgi:hypothetical protein
MIKDTFGTLLESFERSDQLIAAYLKEYMIQQGEVGHLLTDL